MTVLKAGHYRARIAGCENDVRAAQVLRQKAFVLSSDNGVHLDCDAFDSQCIHFLVEDLRRNSLVCCFRILHLTDGADISRSYSAQFYDLSALKRFSGPMAELGRFCVEPRCKDADVLRVAWAALAKYVDQHGIELLFGCSSFKGTTTDKYVDTFAMLKERYLAPRRWLPRAKAPLVFRFARKLRLRKPDTKLAMVRMPPLLRTYLAMGGWVSDHAVIDRHMNTLHVFTGLEINSIPAIRKRLLRAVAQ